MRPSQQMRDLDIVQYGAPVLRDPGPPSHSPMSGKPSTTTSVSSDVMERIRRTHDFSGKGLGLAAPQIGIGRSAAVVQPPGSAPLVLLNPRITDASEDMDERFEGCLSFFDVRAQVPQPLRITVETMTAAGSTEKAVYERGDARLIAHEIDHLDGLLLMDRMRPGVRPVPVEEYRRTAEPTGRPWSYE
ncbi:MULTISPECIES: peptide deformylase [unclassified Streptomyces]|uniref:peptide deformylase n=1 Tax=unclassified Streptomyces TaxID=2593676 RepID=UPI0036EA3FB4